MALLFLVVAMLLALIIIAMVIIACCTKKGLKSNQPSHRTNQDGIYTLCLLVCVGGEADGGVGVGVYVYLLFLLELEPNATATVEDLKNPMYDPTITTIDEGKHVYPYQSILSTLYIYMS